MHQFRAVHFVGFRGEEFWSAVRVWGRPDFVHHDWDWRNGEVAQGDTIVFAKGDEFQERCKYTRDDSSYF